MQIHLKMLNKLLILVQKVSDCSEQNTCSTVKVVINHYSYLRKMIMSDTEKERKVALNELFTFREKRHQSYLEVMKETQ